jgi:hypothetical protein
MLRNYEKIYLEAIFSLHRRYPRPPPHLIRTDQERDGLSNAIPTGDVTAAYDPIREMRPLPGFPADMQGHRSGEDCGLDESSWVCLRGVIAQRMSAGVFLPGIRGLLSWHPSRRYGNAGLGQVWEYRSLGPCDQASPLIDNPLIHSMKRWYSAPSRR